MKRRASITPSTPSLCSFASSASSAPFKLVASIAIAAAAVTAVTPASAQRRRTAPTPDPSAKPPTQAPPPAAPPRFKQHQPDPPTQAPNAPADDDAEAPTSPASPGDADPNAGDGSPANAPQSRPAPAPSAQRAEPAARPPADPLAVPPSVAEKIGSDADDVVQPPTGDTERRYFPYYESRKGDARFRFLPPLYLEHTRGLPTAGTPASATSAEDRESLYGLLYYQRRSPKVDADVFFPLAWRVRDENRHVLVLGPLAHREAPGEHDNWIAPLFFEGERKDGGYFHSLPLLTTSQWDKKGAFTLVGPYFRSRSGSDVGAGIVPLWFHGDNGDTNGARKTYTLIPPLLFYQREREVDDSRTMVIGPVVVESNAKRRVFDVAPLFFHIQGRPEASGKRESHTTLFPLFHYGHTDEQSLFVLPGYLRRKTQTADTMLTPFYSHAETRSGSTSLTMIGPVLPLFFRYTDKDIGLSSTTLAPLFHYSASSTGQSLLLPIYGRFETYGVSRTRWIFPTFTMSQDLKGWETDLHPIVYLGRSGDSSHTVVAPFFWDFASPAGRTTVGFPAYWRFADSATSSVTQVAANTVYLQKRVAGGIDWQFHLVPLFSYGENPSGYFWNILFGLAGYERAGDVARVKALWLPIQVSGPSARAAAWAN